MHICLLSWLFLPVAAAAAERKEEKGRWVLGILLYVRSEKSTEKTGKNWLTRTKKIYTGFGTRWVFGRGGVVELEFLTADISLLCRPERRSCIKFLAPYILHFFGREVHVGILTVFLPKTEDARQSFWHIHGIREGRNNKSLSSLVCVRAVPFCPNDMTPPPQIKKKPSEKKTQ